MGSIALNKPAGGQTIIAPEDGTSTETVTIPSVGVGKVLQVAYSQTTDTNTVTTSTSSYATAMSVTITPTSPTSKFILEFDCVVYLASNGVTTGGGCYFDRDGTQLNFGQASGAHNIRVYMASNQALHSKAYMSWVDEPNTSSPITYNVNVNAYAGTVDWGNGGYASRAFRVMEIAQ